MSSDGKNYERFVGRLQQALLNADKVAIQKNIKVEINKKITDNLGIEREFDVYWEYELGGLAYKTVIECKDYNSYVSVEKIDALIGKIKDIPDLKAVFATKKGYQSGAKTKAEMNKIDLLIVREQNESDWVDSDGTPLFKGIRLEIHIARPATIHKFEPMLDVEWAKNNTRVDLSKPLSLSGLNNEIIIDDVEHGIRYSLHELASRLSPLDGKASGVFTKTETFKNAFLRHKELELKIRGYKVGYSVYEPTSETIEMDFSQELDGVIEYLQKGTKKSIFRNGVIRQDRLKDN